MHIYVDNIKLNVDKLESVYIINQSFGNGTIKYKGRILKPENNFLYYDIKDGDYITFKGLRGGGSKVYTIIFTVLVILIFIILLLSGFITVLSNLIIGSVKCVLLNSLQTINYCNNNIKKLLVLQVRPGVSHVPMGGASWGSVGLSL